MLLRWLPIALLGLVLLAACGQSGPTAAPTAGPVLPRGEGHAGASGS